MQITSRSMKWLPSAASGVTATSGGSAWTYGSGVSLGTLPSSTCALVAYCVGASDFSTQKNFLIQIGIGSTPTWTHTLAMGRHGTLGMPRGLRYIHIPLSIAASQQLYVRIASEDASRQLTQLKVGYIENPDVLSTTQPMISYPTSPGSFFTLTPSGTTDAFGSWVTIDSSTSTPLQFHGCGGRTSETTAKFYIQLGVGTTPKITLVGRAAGGQFDVQGPPAPVLEIPSGSNLVARVALNSTGTGTFETGFTFFQNAR